MWSFLLYRSGSCNGPVSFASPFGKERQPQRQKEDQDYGEWGRPS